MSEPIGGGFTGDADGAPYTGYDPGPVEQSPVDVPAGPSGLPDAELQRLQEIDKPIEHDPIGQALISLPVGLAQGAVSAAAEGVGLGAELLKEGVAWAAAEIGIGAGEHLAEGAEQPETPAEDEQYDDGGVVDE